jgi:hypothetical protein
MVKTNKDITNQNHVKLSILLLQNGLSFCAKNTLDQSIEHQGFINKNQKLLFHNNLESFDQIHIAIVNQLNTFVPKSLFDSNTIDTYLQFNTKVLKNDQFGYDEIPNFDIINVYVSNEFKDVQIQEIETTEKTHFATTLVAKLLEQNKNIVPLQFFVHFITDSFQIVIIQNSQLMFYNTFNFTTEIDVLYYILFVAEQFKLNPEEFSLILLGEIAEETPIYNIIYQYVRNVSFYQNKNITSRHQFVLNQL